MAKRDPWEGKLYRVWRVECGAGGCHVVDERGGSGHTLTRAGAEAAFRGMGWRRAMRKGWLCPRHAKPEE